MMDVEYQKKEVSWCLDRVGPKICLKAITIDDKLQQLEITSDEFRLELENEEAIEFLGILRNVMSAKPAAVPVSEDISPSISIDDDIIPSIPTYDSLPSSLPPIEQPKNEIMPIPKIQEEKPKPVTTLDTSEILEVLKQSESSVGEERISFRKKFAENEAREPKPDLKVQPEKKIEELSPSISIEENVKPSEVFKEKLDTASFFREAEEKSPLEQLLEENEDFTSDITTSDAQLTDTNSLSKPEGTISESEESESFTPADLNSSSFMSKFNSKPVERALETPKPETIQNAEESDSKVQDTDPVQPSAFLSEDERKKDIEKERAARKKRLWELTRGF
ncbi:MAG: hypothetical protein ACW98F_02510 [Candidatus Hodarchaeales archaeon]|jgi:hypothetical protein